VVWTTADDDPVLDAVAATDLPAVIHGGPGRRGLAVVAIDDRASARAIGAEAFAGARRPAVLSFPLDRARRGATIHGSDPAAATFPVTRRRLEGLRDACVATGGAWARVPVCVCSRNSAAEGEAAAAELLRRPDAPDAIAAMSDELALGALRAAARARVPVPDGRSRCTTRAPTARSLPSAARRPAFTRRAGGSSAAPPHAADPGRRPTGALRRGRLCERPLRARHAPGRRAHHQRRGNGAKSGSETTLSRGSDRLRPRPRRPRGYRSGGWSELRRRRNPQV
jgi:hypothetical protein